MAEAAGAVGRLDRLTEGLVLPHPRVRSGADSRRLLERFLGYIRERGCAPGEPLLAGLVDEAQRFAEGFAARLAPLAGDLPRGIVHHDAQCGNVLFRGGRLVALIDFDDACPGYLISDPAVLLGGWAIDPQSYGLRLERAIHLLGAYERQRRLTAAEREILPDFLVLYALGDAVVEVQDELERGTPADAAVEACGRYHSFRWLKQTPGWGDALRRG
jgi:Ser/Thr protein kinase RdoA (MazF antagonist)